MLDELNIPKDIKVYKIKADSVHIGCIRFDKKTALLLNGSSIVYDHSNDTFHLITRATPENVEDSIRELMETRERKAKDVVVKRK